MAQLRLDSVEATNPLASHGGLIEGGPSWDAPITLNGNTRISGNFRFNQKNGGMGGPGGLTLIGGRGPWGWENTGTVSLYGTNTYTGPTSVLRGTLQVKKAASLYHADPAQWTAAKISVYPAATLVISAGGPGEFSGDQVGALLTNLTAAVHENGLMARCVFCLDTANATGVVTVSADITDAKGPGGGAFVLKKCGAGALAAFRQQHLHRPDDPGGRHAERGFAQQRRQRQARQQPGCADGRGGRRNRIWQRRHGWRLHPGLYGPRRDYRSRNEFCGQASRP